MRICGCDYFVIKSFKRQQLIVILNEFKINLINEFNVYILNITISSPCKRRMFVRVCDFTWLLTVYNVL